MLKWWPGGDHTDLYLAGEEEKKTEYKEKSEEPSKVGFKLIFTTVDKWWLGIGCQDIKMLVEPVDSWTFFIRKKKGQHSQNRSWKESMNFFKLLPLP